MVTVDVSTLGGTGGVADKLGFEFGKVIESQDTTVDGLEIPRPTTFWMLLKPV